MPKILGIISTTFTSSKALPQYLVSRLPFVINPAMVIKSSLMSKCHVYAVWSCANYEEHEGLEIP